MTLKSYLWGMKIGAVLSFAAWTLVVVNVDPRQSGLAGALFFYGSFFLFLSALFALFFTWLRKKTQAGDEMAFHHVGASFRQGILLALLANGLLFLQSLRVLTWWDGALALAGVFLVEFYFLTRRR